MLLEQLKAGLDLIATHPERDQLRELLQSPEFKNVLPHGQLVGQLGPVSRRNLLDSRGVRSARRLGSYCNRGK